MPCEVLSLTERAASSGVSPWPSMRFSSASDLGSPRWAVLMRLPQTKGPPLARRPFLQPGCCRDYRPVFRGRPARFAGVLRFAAGLGAGGFRLRGLLLRNRHGVPHRSRDATRIRGISQLAYSSTFLPCTCSGGLFGSAPPIIASSSSSSGESLLRTILRLRRREGLRLRRSARMRPPKKNPRRGALRAFVVQLEFREC